VVTQSSDNIILPCKPTAFPNIDVKLSWPTLTARFFFIALSYSAPFIIKQATIFCYCLDNRNDSPLWNGSSWLRFEVMYVHKTSSIWNFFIINSLFYIFMYLSVCLSMALQPFVGPWPLYSVLIFYTVAKTLWTGDQPIARPLPAHRTTQTHNNRRQTDMP
jgi:hypothetical protein